MDGETHHAQESGVADRAGIGMRGGVLLGALATIVLGLAIFGAVMLTGRSISFARAQTADGTGQMMFSGGSGGDMQSMMANGQGMASMDEMVTLCTQHMREMSAMMQNMQTQPGAPPAP